MAQLGKYDTDRDNILHYLCTSDWANDSGGNVESPQGYFWRISNKPEDVQISNTETTSLIEDQLASYDIADTPEFRKELEGHFLVIENTSGLVDVFELETEEELIREFDYRQEQFGIWDTED